MSKWKCEICNSEFENFQAQGFNNKIYCPLCYFKELNNRKDKEIQRLNNIIEKAIYCINLNQEKSGSLSYENCKRVKGILKGDEFHLRIFEEQVKELKGDNNEGSKNNTDNRDNN